MRIKKLSVIESRVFELLEPVVSHAGMQLVTVEYKGGASGMVLRLVIDRQDGVTIDDCVEISRTAGDILDIHEIISERYNLEVSSPGINRPLVTEKDLVNYAGEKVLIKAEQAIDGRRRFRGILEGMQDGNVIVRIDDEIFRIPSGNIAMARLDII